jgi:hypothetical protein
MAASCLSHKHAGNVGERLQAHVVGPGRSLAAVKDTNWVLDRKPLAARLPPGSADGLLHTAQGCLLEGLVTNLFVLRALPSCPACMVTAPHGPVDLWHAKCMCTACYTHC